MCLLWCISLPLLEVKLAVAILFLSLSLFLFSSFYCPNCARTTSSSGVTGNGLTSLPGGQLPPGLQVRA